MKRKSKAKQAGLIGRVISLAGLGALLALGGLQAVAAGSGPTVLESAQ
ncbi:MAG: hypothetical protein V3R73_03735 [Sphingomonadales bacterium]